MEQTQCAARTVFAMRLCGVALGLVGLALMPAWAPAATAPEPSSAMKAEIDSNYGKLPLSFEANQGQTDSQVKFLARGRGYALFLTSTEAVLSLAKPQALAHAETSATSSPEASGTVLAMRLSGANLEPQVTGKDALPGRVNYLRGKDPAHWQTQIPTYAKVAYEGIYPGVDLVYYGNQGQLEYDFVVAPGADPGVLKLVFRGADRIEINAAGELVLSTASRDIRMHAPVIYQETAGVRTNVAGGYVLKEPQQASFEVAVYDTSRPLVIDPVLAYSTYLGGSADDRSRGIAVSYRGNAYITGQTLSTDFPTVNAGQPAFGGGFDAFVAKLNRNGSQLLYSTYLGGSMFDIGLGIVVDDSGNAYVTGITFSTDFPTVNAVQPAFGGSFDAFVAKLNRNGSQLLYSTYLGGSGGDEGRGIAVDGSGNAYVTGRPESTDFPTVNAVQPAFGGGFSDAFVTKLNQNGSQLLYSTYLGGSGGDFGFGIAVDDHGNAYVTGNTGSPNFPTTVNAVQPAFGGGIRDAFVTKLNQNGSQLLYSTYLGGSGGDFGFGIAVNDHGNAYVTGNAESPNFPTVNAVQPASGGGTDAFVTKLNRNGSQLLYSTYLGGSREDIGRGIAVDGLGNAYVTGRTASTEFPAVNPVQPAFGGGIRDAFVTKLAWNGTLLLYSTYLGGSAFDEGLGIAVDGLGNAYVTGLTVSSNFPTVNAVQPASGGAEDAFVAKLRSP